MDTVIAIGEHAPDFQLQDIQGNNHALKELLGSIIVINFWSAECSWCERVDRELAAHLERWPAEVRVWWVASNAGEPFEQITRMAAERKLSTVLVDTRQQVADLYGAQTTPHFFVVDKNGRLAYQGAWDDVTFRQRVATQVYVPKVIEALLEGQVPELTATPPYGCVLARFHEGGY